jgi:hypothetical protein
VKATEENKQSFESGREVNLNPLYVRSVVYSFGSGMVSPVIAIYNLIIGLVTFAGSLIAGYLADFAIGIYGLVLGLQIACAVSTVGRVLGTSMHLTLKETPKR